MIRAGEGALLVEVDRSRGRALAAALESRGYAVVVPGMASVLVEFDPLTSDEATVRADIERELADPRGLDATPRLREIPTVYGGELGPDLGEVARLTGLDPAAVVERHAGAELEVQMLGFAPGFAYVGDLPPELSVPRLATPRTSTPAGSVAIAGRQTGIYPSAMPGGWRVIGRTALRLFDPERRPPVYLLPGDRVRFVPVDAARLAEAPVAPDDW